MHGVRNLEISTRLARSKAKKLRVKEVAAVAQSIMSAQESLPTEIITALKSSRHLDLFVDRKQLVELLEQKSTLFYELVASISSDTVQESEREAVCRFSTEVARTCQASC